MNDVKEIAQQISYEIENINPEEISIIKIRTSTVKEWHDVVETVKTFHYFKNVLYVHVPIDQEGNSKEPTIEFVK